MREKELHWVRRVDASLLLTVPVHGISMARAREHAFLCGMRPQTSCNARVQMGLSEGRAHELVHVSVGFYAVRAHESFVQCASAMSSCPCSVLVGDQYGSWMGACANEVVALCSCVEACAEELMCKSQYLSKVLAHPGFVQCAYVLGRERV